MFDSSLPPTIPSAQRHILCRVDNWQHFKQYLIKSIINLIKKAFFPFRLLSRSGFILHMLSWARYSQFSASVNVGISNILLLHIVTLMHTFGWHITWQWEWTMLYECCCHVTASNVIILFTRISHTSTNRYNSIITWTRTVGFFEWNFVMFVEKLSAEFGRQLTVFNQSN